MDWRSAATGRTLGHLMFKPGPRREISRHHGRSRSRFVIASSVVLVALASSASAQHSFAPRFRVDHWTSEDGLPGESIRDLIQSADGYLWILASGSVVRFDGNRFVSYSEPGAGILGGTPTTLVAAGGDTVFVAQIMPDGTDYVRITGDRPESFASVREPLRHIMRDGDGTIWLGSTNVGVRRLEAGTLRDSLDVGIFPFHEQSPELGPQWMTGRFGRLWLNARHRDSIGVLEDDAVRFVAPAVFPILVTRPSTSDVLFPSVRGDTVVIRDDQGVDLAAFLQRDGSLPRLVDRHGRLWVSTRSGLEVYTDGSVEPVVTVGLSSATDYPVSGLFEDREGNLWARTYTSGLFRIQEQPTHVIGMTDGLRVSQAWMLASGQSGSMLALDALANVYRIVAGQAEVIYGPALEENTPVVSGVAEDGSGTLWITTQRFDPLYPEQVFYSLVRRRDGLADLTIPLESHTKVIREDPRPGGPLWFGASVVYRAVRTESSIVLADTFPIGSDLCVRAPLSCAQTIRDLAIDRSGAAWIPADSALVRISGDAVEKFSGPPYPDRGARSVLADDDGTIWIGTYGHGLLRFRDGVFRAVTEANGLGENIVSSMEDDGAGNIWMAGNRSIHRVSRADLSAFFDGTRERVTSVMYTRADGIPNPETSGYQSARDDTGRLWFATFEGIVVIDPAHAIALEADTPLVHIEEIVLANGDTRMAEPDESGAGIVRLGAGERRFDVGYTAISLRDPAAVNFRYKLDGLDDVWREAGNIRTATYTNVGPGRYTFRVQAVSGGGVPSNHATLRFVVAPFFYETTWFMAFVGFMLLGATVLIVRQREQRLLRRQVRLNQLVDERTTALRGETKRSERALRTVAAQAEQLRSLDQARSRFFANVSHEFRTPLTLMVGPLRDVQQGRLGELPDAAKREIDVVLESGHRLNELVDQLLDIARLEVGELTLDPRTDDVVAFLRRIARSFDPLARARDIAFDVVLPNDTEPLVYDQDRLDKVINNLLGNAFKFTGKGGHVRLMGHVEHADKHAGFLIRVQDDGIGIPEHLLHRVFDRFYQVDDSPNRQHHGAGLGLALTKDLVTLHGGTIDVSSIMGEGSTFTVRLPLADDSPLRPRTDDGTTTDGDIDAASVASLSTDARADRAASNGEHDTTTVLLVEDNDGVRSYLRRHLEEQYRVLEAEDGRAGLEETRRVVPDLIISDIMMPDMDGQTMVEEIRKDPHIDFVPVILLTAKASHESLLTGLRGGADDYITKPFDIEELLLRASNLITGRRKIRERFKAERRTLPSLAAPFSAQTDEDAEFMARANTVLADHVDDEDFGVEELAQSLHMSRSSLYRRTEQVMGRSPMDVVIGFRLDQAAQWLRETDAKVNEIAYGVGFKSVPHFSRKFRERFDTTPTEYRQS